MKLFYMDSGAEIIGIARAYLFKDSKNAIAGIKMETLSKKYPVLTIHTNPGTATYILTELAEKDIYIMEPGRWQYTWSSDLDFHDKTLQK